MPKAQRSASGIGRPLSSVRRRPSSVACRLSSTLLNISSETAWPIKVEFHMEPPWDGGKKVCSGHMTKMAAIPYLVKNLLLQNQKADDLETWYASSGA